VGGVGFWGGKVFFFFIFFLRGGGGCGVLGVLIGGGGKGLFFLGSGWGLALKYLFLVIGGVGDTWIYFKFRIFFIIG